MTCKAWVHAKHTISWLKEASHMTHYILPCCQWLWDKIQRTRKCTTLAQDSSGSIQNHHRLDGWKIYWTYLGVGLYQLQSPSVNAWVCSMSTQIIPTCMDREATVSTITACAPILWTKNAMYTTDKQGSTHQQTTNEIYPRSNGDFSRLCEHHQ